MSAQELKQALRAGPYAWPGGYPLYFITSDGEPLSFAAVRENYRQVLDAMRHGNRDGWGVVAITANWEDGELYCAHTGERIPSAYAEEVAA